MHIFIDETGSFSGIGQTISPSLVGALIVPDAKMSQLESKYQRLRLQLPKEKGEVKGRLLDEQQVAKVVELLRRNEAIYEAVMIDLGLHTKDQLELHRKGQADGFTRQLTPDHHESFHRELGKLRRQLEGMALPLYVQSVLIFDLINNTVNHATAYYAQRRPKELGAFHWVIDAKDKMTKTEWENWWSYCILPILQSKSFRNPGIRLDFADYSYFSRFEFDGPFSNYYDQFMATPPSPSDPKPLDLKKVMQESFRFSSQPECGLELVDVITNGIRRALIGNLQHSGWSSIPSIMINRKNQCLSLIALHEGAIDHTKLPYQNVLRGFLKGGRSMLTPNNRRP